MNQSFHSADKATHRKVVLVSALGCAIMLSVSLLGKSQSDNSLVVLKAGKATHTVSRDTRAD
jgi:hypothetical protein